MLLLPGEGNAPVVAPGEGNTYIFTPREGDEFIVHHLKKVGGELLQAQALSSTPVFEPCRACVLYRLYVQLRPIQNLEDPQEKFLKLRKSAEACLARQQINNEHPNPEE